MNPDRAAAELRGEEYMPVTLGAPLNQQERYTLSWMAQIGPSYSAMARAMHLHVNTVKYRMNCVADKYGMKRTLYGTMAWRILVQAVKRGDVVLTENDSIIRGFVCAAVNRLPTGPATPLSSGIRAWLNSEADQYLREREVA